MASVYSIKDMEVLSGIKAHTIRMWEQRYGLLKASRTATNIRYYSDDDLKYIMRLALLNKRGQKISRLAALSREEVGELVQELSIKQTDYDTQLEGLVSATIEFDELRIEKIINTSILQLGFEGTFQHVVFPFLDKLGILWVSGTIMAAQEHFVSQLIRQKIIVAIDGHVTREDSHTKKCLLFLPNGEWHELTLLYLQYLLKSREHQVTYLGASVPLQEVLNVAEQIQANCFFTIITSVPSGYSVDDYLNTISNKFPKSSIFASGSQFINTRYHLNNNISVVHGLEDVLAHIDQMSE